MLKLTENGQSSLNELTEMRRVFSVVSKYEFLMGDKHYSAVQAAFIEMMRQCENDLVEEIFDANDLEAGWREPDGEQGRSASEVH